MKEVEAAYLNSDLQEEPDMMQIENLLVKLRTEIYETKDLPSSYK